MSHGGHDCGSACAHGFNLNHTQTLDELDFERGIWTAALEEDVQRLRSLLDKGHCVNKTDKYGYTALHYAARNNRLDACKVLTNYKCNVNIKTGPGGTTPLMRAAMRGHAEVVELLLRHGADPSLADLDGSTALDHALKATPSNDMVIAMLRSATT